ncbi:NAD(P)-dependent alcohol dehydrogenase [Halomicrobium salinisoli]|uniref:NAD(P)-dependent alcohol dehydrogenase n=1 Tax=Halomicrobium salinisoli TaxID=2878391 RepID=UPI001CF094B2|nr:NAD(P)-dependent alcohol dehydrogenase [Halomicrobium salinisoli]
MRACQLTDVGELTVAERDRPAPGSGEVLVRIDRVGICGSDLHYYEHGVDAVDFPLVLGHEPAGTVVEVGADVTGVTSGDRVAVEPGRSCGECAYCAEGEYHLCPEMAYMSSPPVDGALVEYVAWPADLVYPLPDDVSLREGALAEPLSVAVHACDRGDVGAGDSVLVTGGGPIGQLVATVALARGAEPVVLTDVVAGKLDLATDRGVDHAVDATERDPAAAVRERVDPRGVDVVIESSGAPAAVASTTDAVRRGGTIVFVGMPDGTGLPVDVVESIEGEYDLRGSYRFAGTYPEAIRGIADGRYDVDGVVSFEAAFDDTPAAFERAAAPEPVKGVVRVHE